MNQSPNPHKIRSSILPAGRLLLPGVVALLLLLTVACSLETQSLLQQPSPPAASNPAPTPTLNLPSPTATIAILDTGWAALRLGLERRSITQPTTENQTPESLYILRIDPAHFRFDVAYHPGQPQSLAQWQEETGALIVVNGGFFTEAFIATGLVVANGQANGVSYQDFGGMFAVTAEGPGLRWLPQQPHDPAEPLLAALQSFPMLVTPGGQLGYPDEDNLHDRRTVIAQDTNGRILFILAATGTFSLHQMSRFLVQSDLNIDRALNLDGGTSTGLLLADPPEGIHPFSLLPTVITVHPQ